MGRNTASSVFKHQHRWKCAVNSTQGGVLLAVSIMLGVAATTMAAPLEYGADIFSAITYTNNVGLSSSDTENGQTVFEISPRVTATRDGKNLDVNFNYRLQALFYGEESDRNEAHNYLQANIGAELVPQLIHVDADASISQTLIDPTLSAGFSSISAGGNRTEVATYSVSPYLQKNLAPFTSLRTGVRASLVEYEEARLIDNDEFGVFASVANQGGAGPINWRADFDAREISYDIGQQIKLQRISGEVGYRIGPRTEVVLSGGEDSNDFDNIPGNSVAEGSFWNVGLRGGIGNNINYDVRGGEQFFGDSYSVSFDRRSKAVQTQLTYSEAATTVGSQQLDAANALSILTGISVQEIQNLADISGIELPGINPELYIRKRFDFSNTLSGAKSSVRGAVYYEDRTFLRTDIMGVKEQLVGARLEWSWTYSDITNLTATANYQRLNARDGISEPKDLRIGFSARRELFSSSYMTLRSWINTRSSGGVRPEYDEYAVTLGFGHQF